MDLDINKRLDEETLLIAAQAVSDIIKVDRPKTEKMNKILAKKLSMTIAEVIEHYVTMMKLEARQSEELVIVRVTDLSGERYGCGRIAAGYAQP